jgi:hypothetical protein
MAESQRIGNYFANVFTNNSLILRKTFYVYHTQPMNNDNFMVHFHSVSDIFCNRTQILIKLMHSRRLVQEIRVTSWKAKRTFQKKHHNPNGSKQKIPPSENC